MCLEDYSYFGTVLLTFACVVARAGVQGSRANFTSTLSANVSLQFEAQNMRLPVWSGKMVWSSGCLPSPLSSPTCSKTEGRLRRRDCDV